MMQTLIMLAMCTTSAVLGRLFLTRDQAWRTVTVRVPYVALLALALTILTAFLAIFAVLCFVGGSFYGLYTWWLPQVAGTYIDAVNDLVPPIITGRRD